MRRNYSLDHFTGVDSPFKIKKVLTTLNAFVWLLFLLLLLVWPKRGLFFYIKEQDLPLTYLFVFELTFVLIGYLNLQCGNGEIYQKMMTIKVRYDNAQERYFFNYRGIFWSLLHISFLMLPVLPLLLVASLLSGININIFLNSIMVIFQFSIVFRLIGVLIFLILNPNNKLSFFISRVLFIMITGFSWYISPLISPIHIFTTLHYGKFFGGFGTTQYFFFLNTYILALIFILSTVTFYLLQSHIKQEKFI
jgi:hypothetical protein